MRSVAIGLLLLTCSTVIYGQKLERPKELEVGDKVTYKWVRNSKPSTLEQEVTSVTDTQVQGVERFNGNEIEFAVTKSPLLLTKALSIASGVPCTYDPGAELLQFPLEKGKKWANKFSIKGPDFSAQVEGERVVEGVEKVKVPAGEFEAYRVGYTSRYRGSTSKGFAFNGKDDSTIWYAISNGKLVAVKQEYKNSGGEKSTRELAAISYK